MSGMIPKLGRMASRTVRQPRVAFTEARLRLFAFLVLARDPEAYQYVAGWTYGAAPRVPVDEVFPGIESTRVNIERPFDRDIGTSVTATELLVLGSVVRHLQPQRILEIGTFQGNTTLNMAANAADATITTVDLPLDWDGETGISIPDDRKNVTDRRAVGRQFHGTPHETRIRQVFGRFGPDRLEHTRRPFDLIFIDGCHEYDYVKHDTDQSLKQLVPGGVILWHDYGNFAGVSRAVDELRTTGRQSDELQVCAIQGTRLAVGRSKR